MKRWAIRICVFLLLGSIINIAVAWGCCISACDTVAQPYPPSETIRLHFGELLLPADGERGMIVRDVGLVRIRCSASPLTAPQVAVESVRAGWPWIAFEGLTASQASNVTHARSLVIPFVFERPLPYGPLWPGFAINTLFDAAILWLLFAAPFALRRRRRIKRGLCPKCAYPIGVSDICTECGSAVMAVLLIAIALLGCGCAPRRTEVIGGRLTSYERHWWPKFVIEFEPLRLTGAEQVHSFSFSDPPRMEAMFDLALLNDDRDAAKILDTDGPRLDVLLLADDGTTLFAISDRLGRPGSFYEDSSRPYFFLGAPDEAWARLKRDRTYQLIIRIDAFARVDSWIWLQPRLRGGGIR